MKSPTYHEHQIWSQSVECYGVLTPKVTISHWLMRRRYNNVCTTVRHLPICLVYAILLISMLCYYIYSYTPHRHITTKRLVTANRSSVSFCVKIFWPEHGRTRKNNSLIWFIRHAKIWLLFLLPCARMYRRWLEVPKIWKRCGPSPCDRGMG